MFTVADAAGAEALRFRRWGVVHYFTACWKRMNTPCGRAAGKQKCELYEKRKF